MQQDSLFDFENEAPSAPDNTEIIQVLLYYSKEESKDFKRLCKIGIKKEFPADYLKTGNVSDFLLKMLKKYYGT